jgi:hypothetical protein
LLYSVAQNNLNLLQRYSPYYLRPTGISYSPINGSVAVRTVRESRLYLLSISN